MRREMKIPWDVLGLAMEIAFLPLRSHELPLYIDECSSVSTEQFCPSDTRVHVL
jgi:hypothetical protein